MKRYGLWKLGAVCGLLWFAAGSARAQQPQPPTTDELATKEVQRLELLLKLEYYQVFYVDSILRHDMARMKEEIEQMQKAGMQEPASFRFVQEKWRKQIEAGYREVFTPEQWDKYLSSTGQLKKDRKEHKKDRKDRRKERRERRDGTEDTL